MSDTPHVVPRLTVLTPGQIALVHAYSLDILSRTGVRVELASGARHGGEKGQRICRAGRPRALPG